MRQNPRRRWMLTLTAAVLALAPAAMATSASARGRAPRACLHHPGQTVLQNSLVRLFRFRGHLYACAGVHGKAYRLLLEAPNPNYRVEPGVKLAGRYVAWREQANNLGGTADYIYRLNAVTGARDLIASLGVPNASFTGTTREVHGDFVLNAHGTVVWIHATNTACAGHDYTDPCTIKDTVLRSNNNGGLVLDDETNSSTTSNPPPHAPVPTGSLGLSRDGTIAYWIVNGQPHSAVIP